MEGELCRAGTQRDSGHEMRPLNPSDNNISSASSPRDSTRDTEASESKAHAHASGDVNESRSPEEIKMSKSQDLFVRYGKSRDLEELTSAMKLVEDVLSSIPLEHIVGRVHCLINLGQMLLKRYEASGVDEDLQRAIAVTEESVAITPVGTDTRGLGMRNLLEMRMSRYSRLGDAADLSSSIEWAELALSECHPGEPMRPQSLSNLAYMLLVKFKTTNSVEDIERAAKAAKEALELAPSGYPGLSGIMNGMGSILNTKFEQFGRLDDLDEAMVWMEKAVLECPPNDPSYPVVLCNLAVSLSSKFTRFAALKDLDLAIKWGKEAVNVVPLWNPVRPRLLCNLGNMAHKRYLRLYTVEDLDLALDSTEEGISGVPPGAPDRADVLSSLGTIYHSRYLRFSALADLEQAIKFNKMAIEDSKPSDAKDNVRSSILGSLYEQMYRRNGVYDDLKNAIELTSNSLSGSCDNRIRGILLNNHAVAISTRYEYRKAQAVEDLEKAIELMELRVAITPRDNPNERSHALWILGKIYINRFTLLGSRGTKLIDPAVKNLEEALRIVPEDDPKRIHFIWSLSYALELRHRITLSSNDLNRMVTLLRQCWSCRAVQPRSLVLASMFSCAQYCKWGNLTEASALVKQAVQLLVKVNFRYVGGRDQENFFTESIPPDLVSNAVGICFLAGEDASSCLRLLELSRGLIMGGVIDSRSDVSDLRAQHPDLCNRYDQLRIEVDSPVLRESADQLIQGLTYRRREKAVDELEEVLNSIRELPGFEGFQLPPCAEDLQTIACEGPIVILNCTELGGHAILVTPEAIKSLEFPQGFYEKVTTQMAIFKQCLQWDRSNYASKTKDMKMFLIWLWEDIVTPVFRELNILTENDKGHCPHQDPKDLPRVWWIGVGPLAAAPFHAAGNHRKGSRENTLSRAISSYTPTIKALRYAREKPLDLLNKSNPSILTVAMPTTPGKMWSPLKASEEVESIAAEINRTPVIIGATAELSISKLDCPTAAKVMKEIPSHDIIHFACHGDSDDTSPSNSALILRKNEEEVDRLTVEQVSHMNLRKAQIAYLSACSTAENSSKLALADESLFIASAFQLAGFNHILATQWASFDDACLIVATEFYKLLFYGMPHGNEHEGGHRRISLAFHRAVLKLREKYQAQPIKWASFIHTGA